MNAIAPASLAELHARLEQRAAELRSEIRSAGEDTRAEEDARANEVADQKDQAAHQAGDEVKQAEEQRDIDELSAVLAALRRIDTGSYGLCVECGEPIAAQRLAVQPAALRCALCQAQEETGRL